MSILSALTLNSTINCVESSVNEKGDAGHVDDFCALLIRAYGHRSRHVSKRFYSASRRVDRLLEYSMAEPTKSSEATKSSEPIKISGTRQREAKPPAAYVCNICSSTGHWRVNCPTIRAHGRQEVFGKERARKFRSSNVPRATVNASAPEVQKASQGSDDSAIAQPCDDAEPQHVDVAVPAAGEELPRWDYVELSDFPMRATCLQQNVLVTDLPPALQLRLWAYVRRLVKCQESHPRPSHLQPKLSATLSELVTAPLAHGNGVVCSSLRAAPHVSGFNARLLCVAGHAAQP